MPATKRNVMMVTKGRGHDVGKAVAISPEDILAEVERSSAITVADLVAKGVSRHVARHALDKLVTDGKLRKETEGRKVSYHAIVEVVTPDRRMDQGRRIRVKPDSLPEGVTADPRNPFPFSGRMYGFFSAFLTGRGTATVDQMVDECVRWSSLIGAEDNAVAIRRDLINRVKDWRDGRVADREIVATRDGNTYTCTHVKGVPWAKVVGRKKQ